MNKRIIKICITLLVLTTLVSTQIFSTSAAVRPVFRGDVDDNGKIEIDDVTLLQKYLAGIEELNKVGLCAAEVDGDDKLTVDDVTMIQKYCAGIIRSFNTDFVFRDLDFYNFYSDYSSGKAPVGTPITFTGVVSGVEPLTYEFYIDGALVKEMSDSSILTYTFDKAGVYNVTLRVYDGFDQCSEHTEAFKVVEAYSLEQPVISALYFNCLYFRDYKNLTLTANAVGGTEPYEFKFSIDGGLYVQEYSENNTFLLEPYINNEYIDFMHKNHTIVVSVRDASGQTATESVSFFAGTWA